MGAQPVQQGGVGRVSPLQNFSQHALYLLDTHGRHGVRSARRIAGLSLDRFRVGISYAVSPWARAARPISLLWLAHQVFSFSSFSTISAKSEEHTSELQSLMRISYAVFCLK